MDSLFRTFFPFLVPALVSLSGCSSRPALDPAELKELRSQFVLAEEPDDALTVSEVRMEMLGEEAPDVVALIEPAGEAGAADVASEEDGDEHAGHAHGQAHADAEHDEQAAEADASDPPRPLREEMDVVIVGIVGGIPNPSVQSNPEFPFAPGQAMFFLADPEAVAELEEHGHEHAPGEECAFCAAHAADATKLIAGVTFFDHDGKVLPVDVRELFDLKEKDVVVIKGTARAKSGGMVSVDAAGLYVRR